MKKFLKLLALLAVPALMMTGSLTLSGCSADALTGPVVSAESNGSNNGTGSTKTGAVHNEYTSNNGSNNGTGSTKTGAVHNE
uniref:Lipoprotein n=1 Tax=Rhodothermus marinus TaxID=29549 RepID=A0A7V2F4Y1_RHOMR